MTVDKSLNLLESDWDTLLSDKKWGDMGKCLRAIIKLEKNAGHLSHTQYAVEKRIKILEKNLDVMDFKTRVAVVGDILYGRRAIKASATEEFGSAFRKRG